MYEKRVTAYKKRKKEEHTCASRVSQKVDLLRAVGRKFEPSLYLYIQTFALEF